MAELRNIKWGGFIRALLEKDSLEALARSRSLQWFLTKGFRKNSYMLIDDLQDLVMEYRGVKFIPDLINYPRMFEAWDRYNIEGIRREDKVLDVGANIGSFTLPVAMRSKSVIAVEPIFLSTLIKNVELNRLDNVVILDKAVGPESPKAVDVDCQEVSGRYLSMDPLSLLLDYGPFDVVRLDCGGMEYLFDLNKYKTVRQWEVEFHGWDGSVNSASLLWEGWKEALEKQGFGYKARWSKHRHWLYLSASKEYNYRQELQLKNGDMRTREAKALYLS